MEVNKPPPNKKRKCNEIIKCGNHSYMLNGVKIKSVTSLICDYFPMIDKQKIATDILNSDEFRTNVKYTRYQKCVEPDNLTKSRFNVCRQLQQDWKKMSRDGVLMHSVIDHYYKNEHVDCMKYKDVEINHHFYNFDSYTKKLNWTPYKSEWLIYSPVHNLAGSVDMSYIKPDNTTVLIDWKRCTKLYDKCENKCRGILYRVTNSTLYKYSTQLHIYKYILENCYNIEVSEILIVLLHPSLLDFKIHKCVDLSIEVSDILNIRMVKVMSEN